MDSIALMQISNPIYICVSSKNWLTVVFEKHLDILIQPMGTSLLETHEYPNAKTLTFLWLVLGLGYCYSSNHQGDQASCFE